MKKKLKWWIDRVTACSYLSYPTPPTFTDSYTLLGTEGSSIEAGEIGGKKEILVPNGFTRLRPNGLAGTDVAPYKWKSADDNNPSEIGGDGLTTGQQIIGSLNNSRFHNFYNLRLLGHSNSAITGISGVNLEPTAESPNYTLENIRIKNVSFAGFLINNNSAGETYNEITIEYCSVGGYDTEGEGIYLGSTTFPTDSLIAAVNINHCGIANKGRDGVQVNNVMGALTINKHTNYKVGVQAVANQNAHIQIQNHPGGLISSVTNCLFYLAPKPVNIFAHGLLFENCYFVLDANAEFGYFGKQSVYGAGSGSNVEIRFRNCHFGSLAAITNYFSIVEDECDFVFENCTKDSNVTNIYVDNRVDKVTYSITETGTTTVVTETPIFVSEDPYSDDFLKNTNSYFCTRGIGRLNAI